MARRGAYYEAYGPIRDTCGHEHINARGAVDCVYIDRAAQEAIGGTSDRLVFIVESGQARRRLWPEGEV